jgi:hypothetical protein
MKTVIALVVVVMIALVSFAMHKPEIESEETMALQVIAALQRGSSHEYSALFPTVADFHALMMKHSELYGKNIQEAANEFQREFETVLSPAFKDSFQNVRRAGIEAGIDWRSVKLISVEVPENLSYDYSVVPMSITFSAQGAQHKLRIEKALVMNGRWKISQYISLEK